MLQTATPFPQQGSHGFVRGTGEPVRILQRLPGGVAMVQRTSNAARSAGASAHRREDETDLCETLEEAMGGEATAIGGRAIRTVRISGPCAASCGTYLTPGQKYADGGRGIRICLPCAKAGRG